MKIATWNLESARSPLKQDRADAMRGAMRPVVADVWVLTETWEDFSPGSEYHRVAVAGRAEDLPQGCWVAIWSKMPARQLEVCTDQMRMACIRVEQPDQRERDVVIVGTVLPWLGGPVTPPHPPRNAKAFCEAVRVQEQEWRRLWGHPRACAFCVAGDFNQSLPYQQHYGSTDGAAAIEQATQTLGLACLTAGDADPLPALAEEPSIDHICVGGWLKLHQNTHAGTWPVPCVGNDPVTDHYGVYVEVDVLP